LFGGKFLSLASIAKKRPGLYGRVLPVLLGLAPSCEIVKGAQVASVQHTLKNAFLAFLKCTHPGAMPVLLLTALSFNSFLRWVSAVCTIILCRVLKFILKNLNAVLQICR
jgi:hypothetical protein